MFNCEFIATCRLNNELQIFNELPQKINACKKRNKNISEILNKKNVMLLSYLYYFSLHHYFLIIML